MLGQYNDAKTRCQNDNAYLATPRSYYENLFLTRLFPKEHIWIGINDMYSEGRFISVYFGYPLYYTYWAPGEPSQSGNEDGVHIIGSGGGQGRWNDESIHSTMRFVCFRRI